MDYSLEEAARRIARARHLVAFTGAGISAESGIPTFRGPGGIWDKYDPQVLELDFFLRNYDRVWPVIKDMFYTVIHKAEPNPAHYTLADWEKRGLLKAVITQNIDNLHQKAGSRNVIEYHGNTRQAVCLDCGRTVPLTEEILSQQVPRCPHCGGRLKPDFVFFGEPIPPEAARKALEHTLRSDVYLVIGTTGIIIPASLLPYEAKRNGATVIEVNLHPSEYTGKITDIFLQGKAGEILPALAKETEKFLPSSN
ncbi:MAG: NAD-dependent deacylase [Chlorobi bacterium]|nr:NAD-dependent deacylase [Chlorobiota bacterium]